MHITKQQKFVLFAARDANTGANAKTRRRVFIYLPNRANKRVSVNCQIVPTALQGRTGYSVRYLTKEGHK